MRLPITPVFERYRRALAKAFKGVKEDVTEENLQARIRGNYLMALSNKFGWLVLTTANKSEMAVGYSTLYGDMAGGFAVIKDVPKMLVYQLAEHANARAGRERDPAQHLRPGAVGRAPARTRRTRTRCRPIPSSTPSSRPMSRGTRARPTSWPEDSTRRRSSA